MEDRLASVLRRSRTALLPGVAVAMLALSAIPAQAAEPHIQTSVPDGVEYRFGEEISTETRWFVETAVGEAWSYFSRHVGSDFEGKIIVVTDVDAAAAEWAAEQGVSESRARQYFSAGSSSFAGLATTGLTVIINDNVGSPGATIHEFTHLVQRHIAGGGSRGPRWLSEGAAEYFDMVIDEAWGIDATAKGPAEAVREITDEWSATLDNCAEGLLPAEGSTCRWGAESLQRLESAAPFVIGGGAVSAYNRAAVATQVLFDLTDEDAYFCYLDAQGSGRRWREAFVECFGLDVSAFYRYFDRTRANAFMPQVPSRFPVML